MGSSAVQALGVRHVGACLMLFVEYDRVDANRHCHYVQRSIGWCVCVCVCVIPLKLVYSNEHVKQVVCLLAHTVAYYTPPPIPCTSTHTHTHTRMHTYVCTHTACVVL